jgi:hypothetical protein
MLRPLLRFFALLAALVSTPLFASPDSLTARQIMERAFESAGGDSWRYPGTIHLIGKYYDCKAGIEPVLYEPYELYRVQPRDHPRGRVADGKIRVSSYKDGKPNLQIAFDGAKTYDMNGPTGEGADAPFWRLTMGFGMLRFALDPAYTIVRLPDDEVDGQKTHTLKVTDAVGEHIVAGVRKSDARVVRITFPTPRGLHDRIFSDFFTKPGVKWVQPGRVRSYINGIKEAEFTYSDFNIGNSMADRLFVIEKGQFASK